MFKTRKQPFPNVLKKGKSEGYMWEKERETGGESLSKNKQKKFLPGSSSLIRGLSRLGSRERVTICGDVHVWCV